MKYTEIFSKLRAVANSPAQSDSEPSFVGRPIQYIMHVLHQRQNDQSQETEECVKSNYISTLFSP